MQTPKQSDRAKRMDVWVGSLFYHVAQGKADYDYDVYAQRLQAVVTPLTAAERTERWAWWIARLVGIFGAACRADPRVKAALSAPEVAALVEYEEAGQGWTDDDRVLELLGSSLGRELGLGQKWKTTAALRYPDQEPGTARVEFPSGVKAGDLRSLYRQGILQRNPSSGGPHHR